MQPEGGRFAQSRLMTLIYELVVANIDLSDFAPGLVIMMEQLAPFVLELRKDIANIL